MATGQRRSHRQPGSTDGVAGVHKEIHLHRQDRTALETDRRIEFKYRLFLLIPSKSTAQPLLRLSLSIELATDKPAVFC